MWMFYCNMSKSDTCCVYWWQFFDKLPAILRDRHMTAITPEAEAFGHKVAAGK